MALIKCKECGKEISDKAEICPYCGINIEDSNELLKDNKKIFLDKYSYEQLVKIKNLLILIIAVVSIFIAIFGYFHTSKEEDVVIDIIKDLKVSLDYPNSLDISNIYITNDMKYVLITYDYVNRDSASRKGVSSIWKIDGNKTTLVGSDDKYFIEVTIGSKTATNIEKLESDIKYSGNSKQMAVNRIMRYVK